MPGVVLYTIDDIVRFPSVSRTHFIECGANTGMEWGNVAVPTVQYSHGMLGCSEWTGVPLADVLKAAGAVVAGATAGVVAELVAKPGHAHTVTDEREVKRPEDRTDLEPWAGGARDVYVRITPTRISGRCIEPG